MFLWLDLSYSNLSLKSKHIIFDFQSLILTCHHQIPHQVHSRWSGKADLELVPTLNLSYSDLSTSNARYIPNCRAMLIRMFDIIHCHSDSQECIYSYVHSFRLFPTIRTRAGHLPLGCQKNVMGWD